MPIQILSSQRLYQQAAEQIAALIQKGEYPVGAKLPAERDLARQLGVSRPTVREALIALEITGLVEVRIGSGAVVKQKIPANGVRPSPDMGLSPFDVVAARRLIEPQVASLAAISITSEELADLNAVTDMMKPFGNGDRPNLDADRLFHRRIAEATHNSVVVDLIDRIWEGMFGQIFSALSARTDTSYDQMMTYGDHKRIVHCIERRDAAGAGAMMLAHLVNVEMKLLHVDDR
jgi:DNA-binding FadR family transcriptional regulator